MKITGVAGSLRDGSHTRKALEIALDAVEEKGGESEMIDLKDVDMKVFDPDMERSAEMQEIAETLQSSDGIILATPMYHGSYSSPIKTLLDHMGFDEFRDMTVGLIGVSGGRFPITALDHLRTVCKSLDAWVLPYEAAIPQAGQAFEDRLDQEMEKRLEEMGEKMIKFARIDEKADTFESLENTGAKDR